MTVTMRRTTLPEREEMLQRLNGVVDDVHMREHFYCHLLKHAGRETTSFDVVMDLMTAMSEYTVGMPRVMVVQAEGLFEAKFDDYLRALITDEAALQEALDRRSRVRNMRRQPSEA